jgi:16S rRNA (cytosine967-C5)-methyltransferase
MAVDMHNTGVIAACDVRPRRLSLLRETMRLSGATHVHIVQVPAIGPLPFSKTFHKVLVDAPCSGLGTIRRDPDIRWRRAEQDLAGFAEAQLAVLTRAADLVADGGRFVYATCSSEPEENEQVIDRFLAGHPGFALIDLRGASHPALLPFLDGRGMMRTVPFAHGLEAFFAAAVVRLPS